MTYQELIEHFGFQAKAAREIGLRPPSISVWQKKGIPGRRQLEIERLTNGALQADPAVKEKYRALLGESA